MIDYNDDEGEFFMFVLTDDSKGCVPTLALFILSLVLLTLVMGA